MKYVIYSSVDETIVCAKKEEAKLVKEYFTDHPERDFDEYDRRVQKDIPCFSPRISQQW